MYIGRLGCHGSSSEQPLVLVGEEFFRTDAIVRAYFACEKKMHRRSKAA
jgi:hypothetical protein